MKNGTPLLVIIGPTAVGKTDISIDVASKLDTEIVSADSMQVYKYMDIGTAKITNDEMKGINHYLIDEVYPDEEFTVSDFQSRAQVYIDSIASKGKVPMVVGGTGLYINSIVYSLNFTNAISNWELREELKEKVNLNGNEYLYNELRNIDPKTADRLHINDTKRIIRALEIYYETGNPMSEYYNNFREKNDSYNLSMIGFTMDRQRLYERINKRVDIMIEKGLIAEVKRLLEMGYHKDLTSMKGLGYKEIIKYLEGEYSYDEAIEILKRDSRRFAKRQITWFRRDERIKWIDVGDIKNHKEIINCIIKNAKEII